ncbi:unnamed protein product [Brassica rapa subsp. narinosa]
MEFDIPLPEELELLEANSYYPEEEDDDDYLNFEEAPYPYPIDGDEEKEEEEESIAQKESNHRESESPDINGCKRPRSLVSDPIVNLDEASEKRIKINENRVEMEDEEWLRRSPVKETLWHRICYQRGKRISWRVWSCLMHSYSLTYKNVKLDPALNNLRESAASDASVLVKFHTEHIKPGSHLRQKKNLSKKK